MSDCMSSFQISSARNVELKPAPARHPEIFVMTGGGNVGLREAVSAHVPPEDSAACECHLSGFGGRCRLGAANASGARPTHSTCHMFTM